MVVDYLVSCGHRRIARVAGIPRFWHTKIRTHAFLDAARAAGVRPVVLEADYTGESGAAAARELMHGRLRPTAILYDNDLMAVSGLSAVQQLGIEVPAELSIVAWDDSPLCELVHPALTALTRDIVGYGGHAARALSQLSAGADVPDFAEATPVLTIRGSSGPAPQPAGAARRARTEPRLASAR
jgi:DNA-binding LacI/PurR family transcriptional regulator